METVNESENIVFDWVPLERVGPFIFGDLIDKYFHKYKLKYVPEEYNEKVNWKVYRKNSSYSVFSESGSIVAVSCLKTCIFKDINIIGSSIEKVVSILNVKPDSIETEDLSEGPQDVYDFDEFELQLWVKEGIVITAICSGSYVNEST